MTTRRLTSALLIGASILSGLVSCVHAQSYNNIISFGDTITSLFSISPSSPRSNVLFQSNGNNFAGTFFWLTGKTLSTAEVISINGGNNKISCTEQVRGLYFNTQRGWTLWPIDNDTRTTLINSQSSYNSLSLSGGFYTKCSLVVGTYTPSSSDIYGQISFSGVTNGSITAGIGINTANTGLTNTFTQSLSGTTTFTPNGVIFDTQGGKGNVIGQTITAPSAYCSTFTGALASTGSSYVFSCAGANATSFDLLLDNISINNPISSTTGGSRTYTLPTGTHNMSCRANNSTTNTTNICSTVLTLTASAINGGTNVITSPAITSSTGLQISNTQGKLGTIESAERNKTYLSNSFTINGLYTTGYASISSGMLYINGTGVGSTGLIYSGDTLRIELMASKDYETTVSSIFTLTGNSGQLTPLSLTGIFSVTTKSEDETYQCSLSKSQKLSLSSLFENIKDSYKNQPSKLSSVLSTMQSMINDMQAFEYNCNLAYLESLIKAYLHNDDTDNHIAPNCKSYPIVYSDKKDGYTSSRFVVAQYYADRESLYRFIDANNPGECRINSYSDTTSYDNEDSAKHIAPNGKIYDIKEATEGFYSPNFQNPKYFTDIDALRHFIDVRNPIPTVWNHTADTSWTPFIYTATNGKEYKIYKTDQGFMSYNLLKPRYFVSLDAIKSFIDKNNK